MTLMRANKERIDELEQRVERLEAQLEADQQ